MDELNENIQQFIKYFRKKANFSEDNLEEVNKILTSDKYSEFIDSVYKHFNKKLKPGEGRLAIQYYLDADEIITSFWDELLGENMSEAYRTYLKNKLNM
jgi:hypothetical protein